MTSGVRGQANAHRKAAEALPGRKASSSCGAHLPWKCSTQSSGSRAESGHGTWPLRPQPVTHTRTARVLPQDVVGGNCLSLPGGRRLKTYVRNLCSGLVLRLPLRVKASPSRSCSHSPASPCTFPYCWSPASCRTAGRPATAQQPSRADQPEMEPCLSQRWSPVSHALGHHAAGGGSDLDCRLTDPAEPRRASHPSPVPPHRTEGAAGPEEGLCPRALGRLCIHVPGGQV